MSDETSEQDFDHDEFDELDDDLDFDEALDAEFGSGFVQLDDEIDDDTMDAVEAAPAGDGRGPGAPRRRARRGRGHQPRDGALRAGGDPPVVHPARPRPAVLAIDAVACLVDGLGDRLGAEAPTMRDALANIRLAFVQIKGASAPTESVD